jgi:two-component system, NarL family, response regulator LiaR
MGDGPVSIAIANDFQVVVLGLRSLLEAYGDRVRIAELDIDVPPSSPVDVVLFDVFGNGEAHTAELSAILESASPSRLAVYTANFDDSLVESAMAMGVSGYLSKALGAAELVEAICRIAAGEILVARGATTSADSMARRQWPGRMHDLSEREAEVLALIARGYENDEIAQRLYISVNTLKTRIRTMYRRMGFDNRVQAAVWAVTHGFGADCRSGPGQRV